MRWRAQLSWRLPPRSRRWRLCLPELASRGATPAWRASWASDRKRSTGPISQSSLAAVRPPQPGSSSSCGAIAVVSACSSRSSSRTERVRLRQRASSSRAIRTWIVCSRRASWRLSRSSQTVRSSAPSGTLERRVELVEVPAQPLLTAASFVDEVVAVVDQQLPLAQPRLLRPGRVEQRLAQSSTGDGERVDQIRLAAHPAPPPAPARSTSAAHARVAAAHAAASAPGHASRAGSPPTPTASAGQPASTRTPARRDHSSPRSRAGGRPRQQRQQRRSACARPPRSRSSVSPPHRSGATGERTGLTQGNRPSSYQVTLDGLGKGGGDTTLASQPTGDDPESSQPPPTRVSCHHRTPPHPPTMTVSSGMTPEPRRLSGATTAAVDRRAETEHEAHGRYGDGPEDKPPGCRRA